MESGNRPLFSVIVPVYKVEKYLHQCVDSILAQTFSDFEVILVDDGSPDRCGVICDEYARIDSRVKVIHQENGGCVKARRAGYHLCSGDYIVHVDSDDYIAPDMLELVAEQIQTHGVDAVLFGFQRFHESVEECCPQRVAAGLYDGEKMNTIRSNLLLGADAGVSIHNSLWSLVMRKEVFEPNLMTVPENLYRGEDLAAVIPALNRCSAVYVLAECPYYYRVTPGSITNTHHGDELNQALLLAAYLLEKMGVSYETKTNSYVLKECFDHLSHYRENWQEYRQEVLRIRNDRLVKHLRGARCGKETSFPNRVAFFLLRHQMFNVLWLIWKIKG